MGKGRLARSVSILGVGFTPLGRVTETPELKDLSERELLSWAAIEAMENGNIRSPDIDAFFLGMSGPNYNSKMKSAAPHFSEWLGLRYKPGMFHDEACGSQGFGLTAAVNAVASGMYDAVLVGAVNINSSMPAKGGYPQCIREPMDHEQMWDTIWTGYDPVHEKVGSPGALEAMCTAYCKEYGVSFDDMDDAFVSYLIHQRQQVMKNPKAVLVKETYEEEAARFGFDSVEDYLKDNRYSPKMGTFVRGRELGLTCDGASACVVCATEKAFDYVDKPIEVAGLGTASAPQRSFTKYPVPPIQNMFETAYLEAGITDPYNEVDHMQIMDAPPTSVIMASEAAGYLKPGESWKYLRDWRIGIDGEKPLNTNGGLAQHGHCLSPSWMTQVAEVVAQMRGQAGEHQMKNPPKTSVVFGGGGGYNLACGVFRAL